MKLNFFHHGHWHTYNVCGSVGEWTKFDFPTTFVALANGLTL